MVELEELGPDEALAEVARQWIANRTAPPGLNVVEPLDVHTGWLPTDLKTPRLDVSGPLKAVPDGLRARRAAFDTPDLTAVGARVACGTLDLSGTPIRRLPDDLVVTDRLDLSDCQALTELPEGFRCGTLILNGCVALERLPDDLNVAFLDLAGCASLKSLPASLTLRGGRLNLRDCVWITALPDGLGQVAQLDLAGCMNLTTLPEGLEVTSWIDIAGAPIQSLPERFDHVGLRWRGVAIARRVVFEPETLSVGEILAERNAEVRRVMMERFGYDRLFDEARAEVLDEDEDAGGRRRLLRMAVPDDEDLVCVAVRCPSTGHRFVLRVPPTMRSCHQAIAWTAGFDNPEYYKPQLET